MQPPLFRNGERSMVDESFAPDATSVILEGDSAETLEELPNGSVKLVVTSPPYNIGKVYERATDLDKYLANITPVVDQLLRVLSSDGSLCWQVGNYVDACLMYVIDSRT